MKTSENIMTNKPKTISNNVVHNFDLSIIMSFYKRYKEFARVLPINAKYLQRNGIEVVIAMDEPSERQKLIELLKQYPFINWKLIVNDKKHKPRNHAPVLNVALKHATKKYIMQIDPEVEMFTDIIFQMRSLLEHYPKHYALAEMAYIPFDKKITNKNISELYFMPYGNLMVERKYMLEINGYDEKYLKWGGEDNDFRARLDMLGVKQMIIPNALTLHREENYDPNMRNKKIAAHTPTFLREMHYPIIKKVNKKSWGENFKTIIYDWQKNIYAKEFCKNYLKQFIKYEIKSDKIFERKYKKILLCQAHNEEQLIQDFLQDMAKYFDAIILLDDESTDKTWQLAEHEKIILKVSKKRKGFDDITNRNILLDLASFFQTEWLCFMDIDERFDNDFNNFSQFEDREDVHVVAFKAVYLWNNEDTYKGDIPYSPTGVLTVYRMFRPIGHSQIITNNKLHFVACPYQTNVITSNILFKDYGSIQKDKRKKKYEMYLKEDEQKDLKGNYDYLLNNDKLYDLDKLKTEMKQWQTTSD